MYTPPRPIRSTNKTSPAGDALFLAMTSACHGSNWTPACMWWDRVAARYGIDIFM